MLISKMRPYLTEDQFKECVEAVFADICEEESDTEQTIMWAVENAWEDFRLSMDWEDMKNTQGPDIDALIKDKFYFVELMFTEGLEDAALEFCKLIVDGLEKVSADPRFGSDRDTLIRLKDELSDCLERKEYIKWFEYRSLPSKGRRSR